MEATRSTTTAQPPPQRLGFLGAARPPPRHGAARPPPWRGAVRPPPQRGALGPPPQLGVARLPLTRDLLLSWRLG
jgi:hypothetical protein